MLTKNQIKLIKSLHEKKYRAEYGLFIVEGAKGTLELLGSDFKIESIVVTESFYNKNEILIKNKTANIEIVDQETLEKISYFETNDSAVVVAKQKENVLFDINKEEKILALDEIKDPGNLGTIIRIADWYGIKNIVASENTVDFYNPKVISASMGSFKRVNIFYCKLNDFLKETKMPVLGAFLDGDNIHDFSFPKAGILLMGNESNGINESLKSFITDKVTIPRLGKAESLNVSIATAIILDNWTK
jgi:TrmH family RNA methyltransferase